MTAAVKLPSEPEAMAALTISQPNAPQRAAHLPAVADAAWHGPIGELVRLTAPATEADPIAVLITCLALFGAMAGDGPFVRVGGVPHRARLWPLIVGKTGAGRKGTSWYEAGQILRACGPHAEEYLGSRVVSGLASGEGLIAALHDDENAKAPDGQLTVFEAEYARVLNVARRDGATLGPILRDLWDGGHAAVITRVAPLECHGAHLGFIGHVTPRELRLKLSESEIAGGTINRLIPVLVERPHLLAHEPDGRPDLGLLTHRLSDTLARVRFGRELRRTPAANELWTRAYAAMNADEPDGILGAVIARGPAQTMRLSLTYALADGADAIDTEHLTAALAVWRYATDSARLLFAEVSGSSPIDRVADYLARSPQGRTRTDISRELFGGNKNADFLDAVLDELVEGGEVLIETMPSGTGRGRSTTRYRWTGQPRDRLARLLRDPK